ncbi:minor tail protein [Streptomyces phage Percastrophe]|uniref:Minor tail protein n=1 Tax=Streptomyces phage Percastrophe TaxID=2060087 RepID=A0A2H5BM48_9CAUD|nr:minor tail protein [Streptomyces phage Percastrophe]
MVFTPIPENTDPWFQQANDAWSDQDARITALEGVDIGANFYYLVASSTAPESVQAKADFVGDGLQDQLAIQQAVDAAFALGGGIVQLSSGVFHTTAPVTLHPAVTLQGVHGDQIFNPDQTTSLSYIQPSATFMGGAAIVLLGQTAGGYTEKSAEQRIRHLTINGDESPAGIHGIQGSDYIHGVTLEDVGIVRVTGKGIYTFTENASQPFSWTMRRVMVDNSVGVGIHLINHTDFTGIDVISIGAGSDAFVLSNMPNSRMIGCRAEWSEGHGYKIEGNWGTGSGSGGMIFSACSTDRNRANGFDITSTGNAPISLVGCYTRRDGRNDGSGGAGFAGIYAAAAATPLVISNWSQYPGQDDGGAGVISPEIGGYFNNNTSVQLESAYIHGATTAVTQSGNTNFMLGKNVVYVTGDTAAPARTPQLDIIVKRCAVNETNNTTTQQASTQLVLPVAANTSYKMTYRAAIQTPVGINWVNGWTAPAGATMIWGDSAAFITSIGATDTWSGSGATKWAQMFGTLTVGATAGNLTATFASGTAANTATLAAGSHISLERIS